MFGHAWDEVDVRDLEESYEAPRGYGQIIALRCLRCKTVRLDAWSRWGILGGRKYVYRDEYKDLNQDLKDSAKAEDSTWVTARKRYLKLRRTEGMREDGEGDP